MKTPFDIYGEEILNAMQEALEHRAFEKEIEAGLRSKTTPTKRCGLAYIKWNHWCSDGAYTHLRPRKEYNFMKLYTCQKRADLHLWAQA